MSSLRKMTFYRMTVKNRNLRMPGCEKYVGSTAMLGDRAGTFRKVSSKK